MDETTGGFGKERVVQVDAPKPKSETRSLIASIAAIALVVGVLAFGIGFALGKVNLAASSTQAPKTASASASIEGWSVYSSEENQYAISHPKKWEAKERTDGVKINTDKGNVALWLLVDQPFLLGEKHQKAISTEEEISVSIDGNQAKGTQYNYKAGNFFIVLVLPDTANTPQVTFWLEADDEKTKDEALKLIESFKFLGG